MPLKGLDKPVTTVCSLKRVALPHSSGIKLQCAHTTLAKRNNKPRLHP